MNLDVHLRTEMILLCIVSTPVGVLGITAVSSSLKKRSGCRNKGGRCHISMYLYRCRVCSNTHPLVPCKIPRHQQTHASACKRRRECSANGSIV